MNNKIVLGTVQFGLKYGINNSHDKPSEEIVYSILDAAYENNIRELDTADAYGNSSEVLRNYFSRKPDKFQVMSKFIGDNDKNFRESFEHSLNRLGVSTLKGYYFHRFTDFVNFKNFNDVRDLKKKEKLKNLGVSLYSNDELKLAAAHPEVDVIQLPFNVFDRDSEKIKLLKSARAHGKQIYARSIFLQGLFFMDTAQLPEKLLPLKPQLEKLKQISKAHKIGLRELCESYVLSRDYIDKILLGVDSKEQLLENISSVGNTFSPALEKEIESIQITHPDLLNPGNWK